MENRTAIDDFELHSHLQNQKCQYKKAKVSDEICVGCEYFHGYVDEEKSRGRGLNLQFTKDKTRASNFNGYYFYICRKE